MPYTAKKSLRSLVAPTVMYVIVTISSEALSIISRVLINEASFVRKNTSRIMNFEIYSGFKIFICFYSLDKELIALQ